MRKISQKIILMLLVFILSFMVLKSHIVYATTDADELKDLLDEFQDEMGDLSQFKEIVDETYNDLYNATSVDNTLKEKLKKDVEKFEAIDDISPLIVTTLDIELNSQINNLTNDNLGDMREEITAIKEWVDDNVGDSISDDDDDDSNTSDSDWEDDDDGDLDDDTQYSNSSNDGTIAGVRIPRAGIKGFIGIVLVISIIFAGIFIIKYRKLREIK